MWNLSGRRKDITRGGSVKVTSAPGSNPCCLLPGTHDANRPFILFLPLLTEDGPTLENHASKATLAPLRCFSYILGYNASKVN